VRAEYLYVHFSAITASGVVSDTAAAYGSAISTSTDLSAHIARAGINYKF
jgi:opacity protein-like surface antigen